MRTLFALALLLTLALPAACADASRARDDDEAAAHTPRFAPDPVYARANDVRRAMRLYNRGPMRDALRDPKLWTAVPTEMRALADSPDARATVAAVIAEAAAADPGASAPTPARMLRTYTLGQVTTMVAIGDAHAGNGAQAAVALASVAVLGGSRDDDGFAGAATRERAARGLRQLVDAGLVTAADLRTAAPVLARAEQWRVSTIRTLHDIASQARAAVRRGEIGIVDAATGKAFAESLAAARTPLEQQLAIARCWQTRSLLDGWCTSLPRHVEKMRTQEASAGADLAAVTARL